MSNTENTSAKPETQRPGVVTLDTPIKRGEQTITQVTLRKPLAGELRGVALADLVRLDVAALQTVLPRISSPILTSQDVAQLELPDLMQMGSEVVGFFMTKKERESLPA
jgi:hypothetical protein